jgi:hypothetical protein
MEYHLYRTKFIKPAQIHLFNSEVTAREMLEKGMAERPSLVLRKNNVWHIGNVEYITESGGRFAIGRTTKTTVEKFDTTSGNFTEQIDDSGPYTFVYFDSQLGLLGIGKKTKVAADVKSIARIIQKLLLRTNLVLMNQIDVRVDFIPDPESFLQKIHCAYAIKRFKAYFTGPNPIDADELFQKPMSYYCQQLEGEQGSVLVVGESLNAESVAAVAKSTAATANGASALIQTVVGVRPIPISFKGDAIKVLTEQGAEKTQTLTAIQSAYREVRE